MGAHRRVRTPLLLQLEASECGAAALGSVLGYHGRHIPLTELRQQCGVSRDGSKASRVVAAARAHDMDARGYACPLEDLFKVQPPFIVFWQFDHFLVVEGLSPRHAWLNDPAIGHRTISLAEFGDHYSGVALTFRPTPQFQRSGRPTRLLPALWSRLHGYSHTILFGLLAGLLLVLPVLALPVFTSIFIDRVLLESRHDWLRPLLWVMGGVIVVQLLVQLLELRVLRRLQLALAARYASQFLWHLLHLPLTFYLQRYAGEISSRQERTIHVAAVLSGKLVGTLVAVMGVGIYTLILGLISWRLTAIGLGAVLVEVLALWLVYPLRREAALRHSRDLGRATGVAMGGLQGMEALKASGLETGFFARWVGHYSQAAAADQKLEQASLALGTLPAFLDMLTTALLLLLGGLLVMAGQMTLGLLVAFQTLLHEMLNPMSTLIRLAGPIHELEADLFRLDDVLAYPAETLSALSDAEPGGAGSDIAKLTGKVELKQVSFGYSPLDPPLLEAVDLCAQPGQLIALVGASGSGKSTLVRLLAGLFTPWGGAVLLDGRPRPDWPVDVLASSVALVDQETMLFEGSLRANLTLWDRTLTDDQLWQACRDACLAEVIQALPGGLDAPLREGGANLSAGQRQRLELARALALKPAVLLLDEAMSALDSETERQVMQNVRRRGCTCILAAHRFSSIRDSDEILVLDHGRIVERGRHAQLGLAQGEYARLLMEDEIGPEKE
jgi:ATP-binding cassette, subfamily C, bacterial